MLGVAALICLVCSTRAIAQNYVVEQSNYSEVVVTFNAAEPVVKEATVAGTAFNTIVMDGYMSMSQVGKPALPAMVKLVELPLGTGLSYEVENAEYEILDGAMLGLTRQVMPAQPSRSKSDRSAVVLIQDNQTYRTNALFGADLVSVNEIGVARDRNLAEVTFCPVRWNPVTNQVEVCKHATVHIRKTNVDRQATERMKQLHHSGAFSTIASTINVLPAPKDVSMCAPLRYTIIAHSSFEGKFDNFVAWKKRQGFMVDVAYTSDANVGTTTTSIAAYLKSQYTNATADMPAPTYVLFIGDVAQIPAFTGRADNGHITDLYYMTWTDGDNIPDCYYGRFSAQNLDQLTPQIDKTLFYEQYSFTDPSYLGKAVLIAGVDGGYSSDNGYRYADPAMDYVAKTYVNAANGYTNVYYYKNNTSFAPNGVTVTGSSQASNTASVLRSLYNTGAGWINYSAHGDVQEWSNPNFDNSDANAMTNAGKYPVMIGNCCLSGKFNESECLGEALLRKANAGAIAYYGGTNYTYWSEDFYWSVGVRSNISNTCDPNYDAQHLGMYDRLFHTHSEPFSDWYITAGSIPMAGNLAVQSSTSSLKQYYWEVYHLMGDPSLLPWLGEADDMSVTCTPGTLMVGSSSATVQCVPYAYVALTNCNGNLVAAAFANASGQATLSFSSLNAPGTYELAVTAQGYKPYFQTMNVVAADGPYVMASALVPHGNGTVCAGDTISFDITLENVGREAAESYTIELRTNGSHLFVQQGGLQQMNAHIDADGTLELAAYAPSVVWNSVPDQTITDIEVQVRWGNLSTQYSSAHFPVTINAPKVVVADYATTGIVQPGSSFSIQSVNRNSGHAAMDNAVATLVSPDPELTVQNATVNLGLLLPGATANAQYALALSNNVPENCVLPLYQTISNGVISYRDTLYVALGTGAMEDFESGTLTNMSWQSADDYGWEITTDSVYAGAYCARSKTYSTSSWGSNTGNSKTSTMKITWTSTVDDSISFFRRVSSEQDYDKFTFAIDGVTKETLSGVGGGWGRSAFYVPAGTHTFSFSYSKDYSVRRGADCAWVDNITFPLNGTARHYIADSVCRGEEYAFNNQTINTANLAAGTYYYSDSVDNHIYFLMLTVNEAPQVSIMSDVDQIRAGESVLLTASGADRYMWSNGVDVPSWRAYPTETTTYGVTGWIGGCSASASKTITVSGSVSIAQIESARVRIYPNPASNSFVVQAEGMRRISLLNVLGQHIMEINATQSVQTINVSTLPKGVYMVRIEMTNGGMSTKKVVLK